MNSLVLIVELIGAIVTICASIGGAYLTIRIVLVKHGERIDTIKNEIEEIKQNRESDFRELRDDMKKIFKSISSVERHLAVLEERTKE